jgi:hypothetical protein
MQAPSHAKAKSAAFVAACEWKHFARFTLLLLIASVLPHFAFAGRPAAPTSAGPGVPFAVADFDGDSNLDYASIQTGRIGASSEDYWVRLRLSASGRRYIRVAAPKGGLRIEAHDVNGDNAVDLVFATAWLNQPVAILLNDGHGNFSEVDPSAYPQLLQQRSRSWRYAAEHDCSTAGLPQEPPSSRSCVRLASINFQVQRDSIYLPKSLVPSSRTQRNISSRAPPPSILSAL